MYNYKYVALQVFEKQVGIDPIRLLSLMSYWHEELRNEVTFLVKLSDGILTKEELEQIKSDLPMEYFQGTCHDKNMLRSLGFFVR